VSLPAVEVPRIRCVLAPGDPAPPSGIGTLSVNVQHFMADAEGEVILDADWSLQGKDFAGEVRHV
jgi:hypothetical protein